VVRGDLEVNEAKLGNVLAEESGWSVLDLRPALEEEIRAVGAEPGYASPVGLESGAAWVVVDESIPVSPNLAAGANEEGYHLLNVNYGRDYSAACVADIAAAPDGVACPQCGAPMAARRGVAVGNIFKLGTRCSEATGCNFRDEGGQTHPVIMGSYGIGVGRLLACIAEEHHDDKGLCWPASVAPYLVHLVQLPGRGSDAPETTALELAARLESAGLEPLYDDRAESAGVKFMDADLIGLPLRLTVSERSLKQGGVELKLRTAADVQIVPLEEVPARCAHMLKYITGSFWR
jgi:prolyl-tRNA synthetase